MIKEENFALALSDKWLDDNDIFMYLTYNEAKSVVAEKDFEW